MNQSELICEEILDTYTVRTNIERPFIVAIDGLSGAGKTTLVAELKKQLAHTSVVIIHIDDYIVERAKRYHTGYEEWYEYYSLQWDVALLKETLFEKLICNVRPLILPFYHAKSDSIRKKEVSFKGNSIVIVEGIFLQREEWGQYFDLTFYIDVPREVRYERVLNRDTYIGSLEERKSKYSRRYWPGENHYLKTVKPKEKANFVIHF